MNTSRALANGDERTRMTFLMSSHYNDAALIMSARHRSASARAEALSRRDRDMGYTPPSDIMTLNLATLLPIVPGNVGVFEGAVVFALTPLGVPLEQALGIAVVQHLCYFIALALPGLLAAMRDR